VVVVAVVVATGCGDDDGGDNDEAAPTIAQPVTTTTVPETLRVLVTNDDGFDAPGIDAIVEALRVLPNTEVTVVAPATERSGSGGKSSEGTLTAKDDKTRSGYPVKAVDGFPADTIIWAFDQENVATRPHLVVSGINSVQNLGALLDLSGTVGAARAAATRGIPALAVSQGVAEPPDYPSGVEVALAWLADHRAELLARDTSSTEPATVTNLNIPTCARGEPRPVVEVPADTTGANPLVAVDCVTPYPDPKTDVDAFIHGYITQTSNLALTPRS
jgi:5'-nucleotidase